ncbi:acyl-coenzyme A synthetase ACSM1, mitochondrial isoform X1 [Alexandromys fortis]|uniref:acyl-coenzyme A synthetase ACSM1, mitochondrial isoform X1 n=1 Tax=Alexandromys fortis TaxID=100897 RepID=UPI002153A601|nr:acyl-coenzyme A synthetase ACSM1, mitochondrial isoform X1 [Microtus fortis]XP_049999180.1 acyl-coenzyme A synthetase ACSM1, mitochondrial isoform X1 [Microtus fortis]
MLWLKKFQIPRGIYEFFHSFSSSPSQQHSVSTSQVWPQRWNDYDSPEEFNFARDVLDYWAQMEEEGKRGPSPALWWVNNQGAEIKWSFRELRDLSRRTANVFEQSCGLKQGDRLALILPRVPEWWLVTVGCFRTGIVVMPGTTQLKAKDILYRLQASQAKAIVTTGSLIPEVDSVASECPALKAKLVVSDHSHDGWLNFQSLMKSVSADHNCINTKMKDPMAIFFTSGTTGHPKMAKHNQGLAFRSCVTSCRNVLKLKTSDVLWCMSDPGWILASVGCVTQPWASGATIFIHHLPQFDPKVIIETLFKYPITQCLAAPAVYRMILQQKVDNLRFPTLEHCSTGGESLLPEEFKQWRERTGIFIHELYGQSEMGLGLGVFRDMKIKKGSMGKAILPFDFQIIDEKGNILPPNTEGYLGIRIKPTRPLGLFVEYENNPEKTAEVECGDFYNTGDRASVDEDGYFWFSGRGDDVINASGYRIGPSEVENALAEHPAVAESAVVGSPDQKRGEVVKAFIVLTPEFWSRDQEKLVKELQQHVKSVTAPYKYPRKIEFVPELPKTITGKIKRKELRIKEFSQRSATKSGASL